MAETKKPVASLKADTKAEVKETTKKAEVKAAEVKAEVKETVKKAEVKAAEVKTEAKETAKKAAKKTSATAKKAAEKTTATAKKAAEKTVETAKKAEEKVAAKKAVKAAATVHVQFQGKSYTSEDLVKIAQDVWVYDLGNKLADFNTADIYVKPEESMAYYVINGNVAGSFAI